MPLVTLPHPALFAPCVPVYHYEEGLHELITDMKIAITKGFTPGAGLAANQVGSNKAVIITNFSPDVALNPMWEPHPKANKVKDKEGCLSDPNRWYIVERYDRIKVTWTNLQGVACSCQLRTFQARVWQHECDHLSGINIRDSGTPA